MSFKWLIALIFAILVIPGGVAYLYHCWIYRRF